MANRLYIIVENIEQKVAAMEVGSNHLSNGAPLPELEEFTENFLNSRGLSKKGSVVEKLLSVFDYAKRTEGIFYFF